MEPQDYPANWNGKNMKLGDVHVSPLDRGFLFGDGIYEIIRIIGDKFWLLDRHLNRLKSSLEAIDLKIDFDRIVSRMHNLLESSPIADGMIYIQVTRGVSKRHHHFPESCTPSELLWVQPIDVESIERRAKQGVRLITYPDLRWKQCNIKSLNLLANCIACNAAISSGAEEAILLDDRSYITEGSHTSVFFIRNRSVVVPPLSKRTLPGITKQFVLELTEKAQVNVEFDYIQLDDLSTCDEGFYTSTTAGIVPILQVDDIQIGNGEPGSITRILQQELNNAFERFRHST